MLYVYIGQFAYIDASEYGFAAIGILEILGLTVDQDYCLEFFYNMHGSDIFRLSVTVNVARPVLFDIVGGRSLYTLYIPCI